MIKNSDSVVMKAYKLVAEKGWGSLFSEKTLRYLARRISYYSYPIVGYILKKESTRCQSVKDIVDFALSFDLLGVNIRPFQIKDEITNLLHVLERARPRVLLEIGTACGGTLFLFTRVAPLDASIISVDLQEEGSFFPREKIPLYRSFSKGEQRLYFLRKDSHNIDTPLEIEKITGGCKIDFLFIDGDHSYDGVKKDFKMYSPLINKGGMMAFHDIIHCDVVHDPEGIYGVEKFWSEIKNSYVYTEIVKDWGQGWGGIGILNM